MASPDDQTAVAVLEQHAKAMLEWPLLLAKLAERARSSPGQSRLLKLEPAATLEEARARVRRVRDVLELGEQGVELPVSAFPDVRDSLARIGIGGIPSGSELVDVLRVLSLASALRRGLAEHAELVPELAVLLGSDPRLEPLAQRLSACLEDDGTVADSASPALRSARARARDAREELKRRLGQLAQRYRDVIQGQYYTERDGRYVLPVRSDAHYRVEGIVLGSSGSGSTLFVEPREVTELGNTLRVREAEVERELARVLAELGQLVGERVAEVRVAFEACIEADTLAALASFAVAARARPIEVGNDDRFALANARHPLLALATGPVVANDIELKGGRALVVSGPNAGGKTVTLKCLGLFAWMARAGIPIPAAAESHVGWFDHVLADVGDEQSLVRSLSTFSAHVENLSRILEHAAPHVLVLLDEVAAGTDPEEGAALAGALLEALARRGAAIAVTTHYERLKELAAEAGPLENASVGFDFAAMAPTFKLTLGVPGASSALAVASRHGLPESILTRAHELLPRESLERERVLREIEEERALLVRTREKLEQQAEGEAARALEGEAERQQSDALLRLQAEKELRELQRELARARGEIHEARARLKREDLTRAELRPLEKSLNQAAASAHAAQNRAQPSPSTRGVALAKDAELNPGDRVVMRETGALATVLERPQRGEVALRVGALKLRAKLHSLARATASAQKSEPRKVKPQAPRPDFNQARRTSDNTIDLRGTRVADAEDVLDAFVDRLFGQGESLGFVLHGHGTFALRDRVREHLGSSSHIEHVRAAGADEGGEAFTVFWLR